MRKPPASNSDQFPKNRIWSPFLPPTPVPLYKMEYPDLFLGTLSIKWYYWGRCCFFGRRIENRVVDHHFIESVLKKKSNPRETCQSHRTKKLQIDFGQQRLHQNRFGGFFRKPPASTSEQVPENRIWCPFLPPTPVPLYKMVVHNPVTHYFTQKPDVPQESRGQTLRSLKRP